VTSDTPAWLTALTILAPVGASFGVLWLSNKQQSKNLQAQHDLALEKDKIAALVRKAEELYSDVQRRKRHLELNGFQHVAYFQKCGTKSEFLDKITENERHIDFDLVRSELNLRAYFPELEQSFRKAEKLIHAAGKIQADMIMKFDAPSDEKLKMAGECVQAQSAAARSLDEFSQALASRIGELMRLRSPNG
jgi:hypothetical protein